MASLFGGPGEMRERCRHVAWANTSLGPVERWSPSLCTTFTLVLGAAVPMLVLWGPDLVLCYNDACRSLLPGRHPSGLGQPAHVCWGAQWAALGPRVAQVLETGEPQPLPAAMLDVDERRGPSARPMLASPLLASAVRDESGRPAGVLVIAPTRTTDVSPERTRAAGGWRDARPPAAPVLESHQPLAPGALLSEPRLRAVYAAAPYGFGLYRPVRGEDGAVLDFRISYVNDAGARLANRSVAEIQRSTMRALWPATDRTGIFADLVRVLETGAPRHREVLYEEDHVAATALAITVVRISEGAENALAVTFADITPRRRADEVRARLLAALHAEREKLRAVILHMPAPVALLEGPAHRHAIVNDAYRRVCGGGRDVTGLTPSEAFPELAGSALFEHFDRVFATGEPWSSPETFVRYDRDGTGLVASWWDLRFEPVRDPTGQVIGILDFAVDVTTQVQARHEVERLLAESEALRARESRFRAGHDAAPFGYALLRPIPAAAGPDTGAVIDFTVPYINDAGARLGGRAREAVTAKTLLTLWPGLVESGLFGELVQVLETGQPRHRELVYAGDGQTRGLEVTAVRIGSGPDAEVGVTFANITARLWAEQARAMLAAEVNAERERLRALIAHMPTPVALLEGPELRHTLVNGEYRRVSGGGRDVTGRTLPEAFPELAGSPLFDEIARVYATGEPWVGPETAIRFDRDGHGLVDTWWDLRYVPVRNARGAVVGVLSFGVDVTPQVLARREMEGLLAREQHARAAAEEAGHAAEAARAEAEAANRTKAEFLAAMSHELRTPLNAIGGYAELLAMGIRGPVTAQQEADLARIQRSQRHLLGLVNEVLNHARLQTGTVDFEVGLVPVRDAVEEAEGLIAPQVRAQGLVLAPTTCHPALAVRADREKLRQILVNLLSNAVKFTARGGHIVVACDPDPADPGRVTIQVQDTGIGIAPAQQARIFEPFVQVRADLSRTAEGTGLGLAISRDLARGMDGELTVASTLGAGSTFTLSLPQA